MVGIILAAKWVAQFLVPLLIGLFTYRILLHPLRRYPGPLLAKLTNAYAGIHAGRMGLHLVTLRDHERYGSVLRAGPNKLLFNSATALQDIYNNDKLQKSHIYQLLPNATIYPNVFNIIDKQKHRLKRKIVGQAISDRAMRLFEPTLTEQIDIMISLLNESCNPSSTNQPRSVNMTTLCKRLGVDIVGNLAFGYSLNTQTEDTYRFLIPGLVAGNLRANLYMQWPTLKKLQLDYILTLLSRSRRVRYYALVDDMLAKRLAQDVHAKTDLVSFLAEGFDADAIENRDEIVDILRWDGIFFFSAGSDTTSSALCALFFYLSRNPDAYRKLAAEIRGAGFKSVADIRSGPILSGCTYLRACIDETLRLSPPVTGVLWRERDPSATTPLVIDGQVIPSGAQIGVNIYSLHHNKEYFPDPFAFRPERWLSNDEGTLKKMNSAFTAFSIGSRACAGKAMAYLELSLVMARTIWQLDFETAPGEAGRVGGGTPGVKNGRDKTGEYQLYDIFASTHDGPNLVFKPREGITAS